MTNFISIKYCIIYMLSLYTIGSYGLSYPSNVNILSTKTSEQLKTTDNYIHYFKDFEERLIKAEETMKNIRKYWGIYGTKSGQNNAERTLNELDARLSIVRNYLKNYRDRRARFTIKLYLTSVEDFIDMNLRDITNDSRYKNMKNT